MRTLTMTLEAAQRASAQEPTVQVLVRDKQARFGWIGTGGSLDVQSAMCAAGSGVLVVAVLDGSGNVRVRRVTDPTVLDPTSPGVGWGVYSNDYTMIVTGALGWPLGDVALSNNSGVLRLFYVRSDGYIYCKESTDGGVTWGTAELVRDPWGRSSSYPYRLASGGHDDLWYTVGRPGYRYIYAGIKSGGVWGNWKHVQYLMETGGEYTNCYGLSVVWDGDVGKYGVVASLDRANHADGRIVSGWWDHATGILSSAQGIAPPGIPMVGASPLWPCLLKTSDDLGGLWLLTYTDKYESTGVSWRTPICMVSRDFDHWSGKIPLGFATTYEKRLCLAEADEIVYCHHVNEAYRLDLWHEGKEDMELTVAQGDVLRYRISEYPGRGELHVELDNRDGSYDNLGVSGSGAEALKPLAQVIINHGLVTEAGTERIESRPFYFMSASDVRESGVNLCRIYAVDGWELLRMWRPDCTIVWQNKTLRWCIEELAARVAFFRCEFDASDEWDQEVDYFSVAARGDWYGRTWFHVEGRAYYVTDEAAVFGAGLSGLAILGRLLGLVGGVARFGNGDSTDVLYCFIPHNQGESPAPNYEYEDGEIIAAQYVDKFAWPTRFRVVGDGVAYEVASVTAGLACGMDFLRVVYSNHLKTQSACEDVADGLLDEALARAWAGWIKARPNVALELFDVVMLNDSRAGGGFTAAKRRVNGIVTEYEPLQRQARWMQTVYLEGV